MITKNKKIIKNNAIFLIALSIIIASILFISKYFYRIYSISPISNPYINYTVYGVDISNHNGNIDWKKLKDSKISFAFIKATEGSSFVDSSFNINWQEAGKNSIFRGAYHFMSFETSGEKQANNFIKTVPKSNSDMPPVIDLELYGQFINSPPTEDEIHNILKPLIANLKSHYGKNPIIYVNNQMYDYVIKGKYDNKIWLANQSSTPNLSDGKEWEFLQYTFRAYLPEYSNETMNLDLNVYKGNKFQFAKDYY